jgi:hypothetical protein
MAAPVVAPVFVINNVLSSNMENRGIINLTGIILDSDLARQLCRENIEEFIRINPVPQQRENYHKLCANSALSIMINTNWNNPNYILNRLKCCIHSRYENAYGNPDNEHTKIIFFYIILHERIRNQPILLINNHVLYNDLEFIIEFAPNVRNQREQQIILGLDNLLERIGVIERERTRLTHELRGLRDVRDENQNLRIANQNLRITNENLRDELAEERLVIYGPEIERRIERGRSRSPPGNRRRGIEREKYLKYKTKYLQLKKISLEQGLL